MTDNASSPLLQPTTLGPLDLSNRVVMAPMTRSRADEAGVPHPYVADYYAQRASAGLIVSEATNVSPMAVGYALTPGIWTDAQVEGWRPVVDAVHQAGGKIVLQLWHTGRLSHPDLHDGELPIAPSAIKPEGQAFTADGMKDYVAPRALETDEIPGIVDEYAKAARNAKTAGFDAVEIHSANNYLIEQFVRDSTNTRTDQYGGSIENRLRFPLAVVDAVVEIWGPDRVGIRLSPATTMPSGAAVDSQVMDTYGSYVDALSKRGLLYIHLVEGTTQQDRDDSGVDFGALRKRFDGAYIANNLYDNDLAAEHLRDDEADLIAFGRPFIANPDFVERLRVGAPLAEAPKQYWYGGDETGYSDWPTLSGTPEPLA